MGVLFAVVQTDPNLLRCQVRRLEEHVALREGERLPDAYGFGYYHGNDVLLGKRPSGAPATFTLTQLAGAVDSEALLVHARHATVGAQKDENTHPFRFRRWLFAHDGTVEAFREVKAPLVASLPDFLRRQVEGDTDSEHVFMLFLKYLRETGHLDDPDVEARLVAQALAHTVHDLDAWCRAAGATRPSVLNLVVTNGRVMAAVRRGRPLHCALLEGIIPCPREELGLATPDSDPRLRAHRQVKAVCLATLLRQPNGFREVPEASVLSVERQLQVSITSMASSAL